MCQKNGLVLNWVIGHLNASWAKQKLVIFLSHFTSLSVLKGKLRLFLASILLYKSQGAEHSMWKQLYDVLCGFGGTDTKPPNVIRVILPGIRDYTTEGVDYKTHGCLLSKMDLHKNTIKLHCGKCSFRYIGIFGAWPFGAKNSGHLGLCCIDLTILFIFFC